MYPLSRISLCAIIAAAAIASAAWRPQPESAAGQTPSTERPIYQVVFLGAGENWRVGVPLEKQPVGEQIAREAAAKHGQYMNSLFQAGTLVMGGPFIGDSDVISFTTISGAMLVLKAETADAARRLAEADPAVQAGIFKVVEVRRWAVALSQLK
jgi:uncharacterized protein YciI